MLETATLLFFPALMVFAVFSDLLTMTISNRVSIALTLLFIALAIASGLNTAQISWQLASGVLILIVGFGLFRRLDRRRGRKARNRDGDMAWLRSSQWDETLDRLQKVVES